MIPDARVHQMTNRKKGAAWFRAVVASLPMTKVELAARLGTTDRTIRAYEQGEYALPYTVQYTVQALLLTRPKK